MGNLRNLREARGWTGRYVAAQAGVSPASVSRAERGKSPSIPVLIKICWALELESAAKQLEWLTS